MLHRSAIRGFYSHFGIGKCIIAKSLIDDSEQSEQGKIGTPDK
jgi:hypothetical protein